MAGCDGITLWCWWHHSAFLTGQVFDVFFHEDAGLSVKTPMEYRFRYGNPPNMTNQDLRFIIITSPVDEEFRIQIITDRVDFTHAAVDSLRCFYSVEYRDYLCDTLFYR